MKKLALSRLCASIFCAASAIPSFAQTFTTLATFTGSNGANSFAPLVQGSGGNFYGTTDGGGAAGFGTVFSMTPAGALTTLYSFCAQPLCADGELPYAGLVADGDGNVYGTTIGGGTQLFGTIFKITPTGALTTLYNFCQLSDCADGSLPSAALVFGSDGNLYGTTPSGGAGGFGTVFQLTPGGALTTLYSFSFADANPSSLVQGSPGNFYGTTVQGGTGSFCPSPGGCGTIYETTSSGALSILYSFCSLPNCTDGAQPAAALILGNDGNFYGTASQGGSGNSCELTTGCGTIFRVTPAGALTTLYSFCAQSGCSDGEAPNSTLLQGTDGNFYGTTILGGIYQSGVIFKLTPSGSLTTVYNFCSQPGCGDGGFPYAGLVQGAGGSVYGTTSQFGADNYGTVFGLSTGVTAASISGQVTLSGNPVSGVTMTLSGSASGATISNGAGNYSFSVQAGGNYTVTPSMSGYSFSPQSRTFSGLSGNQTANFTANAAIYTISGQVTLSGNALGGVTVALSGSAGGSTVTNGSGNYSFTVAGGGNYTVTPSLSEYTFNPASRTFNGVSANQTANFTASVVITTYTISGQVTLSGNGLSGVSMTLTGSQNTATTTDGNGNYSFTVPGGGSYTASPSLAGCVFSPLSQSFQDLGGNVIASFSCQPQSGILSPTPGLTLSGSLANLSWAPMAGATLYQLVIGTSPGGADIFEGTTGATSQAVNFIPCKGAAIYVRLAAEVAGALQPLSNATYSCKAAAGDFNGDGSQDLVWHNNSTGQVNVNYFSGGGPQARGSAVLNNGQTLAGWRLVGAADFDRNGLPDLVYQNTSTGQVNVNYYGGEGGTQLIGYAVLNSGAGTSGWSVVALADMNGDGVPDLIWQNRASGQVNVNYYGGSGGASLIGYAVLNNGVGTSGWQVVAAADFDRNGTPDLVWQNQTTGQVNVNYYGGAGGAKFIGYAVLNYGAGTAGWSVVGAADWNADGVPDLVWQNHATGQVHVNYYGGGGGAVLKGWNCLSCGSDFAGLSVRAAVPFGSSGEQSLLWQNVSNNSVGVTFYAFGGAAFQGWSMLNSGAGTAGWYLAGAADFDGNGVPDLVWQNVHTGQVNVNYYGGPGGASLIGYAVLNYGAGTSGWSVVAVADMNGDGVPDLIWQRSDTGQVNVNYYGGDGGRTLTGFAVLNSGAGTSGWRVVAAADFDGNGVPDLVWQNTATHQVNVNYYGGANGTSFIGWAVLNPGAPGWTVVGASDFDGNGVPDLVWRNDATGAVNVNYYGGPGGAQLKGWNVLSSANNPDWLVIVPR